MIILNVDTYEEERIRKYRINKFISKRESMYKGIIF